jgi:DNA-directed RNA polymerase subunit RPC12/RpoP
MPMMPYQCNQCHAKFFAELKGNAGAKDASIRCVYCGSMEVGVGTVDSRDILMLVDVAALYPSGVHRETG